MGEDVIDLDEGESLLERNIGAIIIATGAGLFDASRLAGMGRGMLPDVYDALQFEHMLSSTGPTGGGIVTSSGEVPAAVAIIHCVGSLDGDHCAYCSGICCQYAFKFNHAISAKYPETVITHYHRELVAPGKEAYALMEAARTRRNSSFIRCDSGNYPVITPEGTGRLQVRGEDVVTIADMVILCPAIVPAEGADRLAALLDINRDCAGFYDELQGRMDASQSTLKGIYLAGACREPMDIQKALLEGMAAVGHALAGLQPGRMIEVEPATAEVATSRCAGCHLCSSVCPYHAISFDSEQHVSSVNGVLCRGCGTCVAACPAGAITGHHFTNEQILAEIEGLLK